MDDEKWMKRALRLAEAGKGRTSPNPLVGAVLVKRGKMVGEGYHAKIGEAHAEIVALRQAGDKARGAVLYVNLEPCTHYGRTPPCAPQVIKAGVKRVVIGMEDPNPVVHGKGIEALKKAGLDIKVGVLVEECRRLNEAFCKYILNKQPFVLLKAAATLDGKIATRNGDSKWISGEASRRLVHKVRDQVDGVLVGVGTILRDDPLLTARRKEGREPYRIVLDSRLKIPEEARVFEHSASEVILATTELAPCEKVERLEKRGVRVLIIHSKEGRVDLRSCLTKLAEIGVMNLLVEGGSQVNGSFLDEGLIDKLLLFLSPRLMGDPKALGIFDGRGVSNLSEAITIKEISTKRIGEDLFVEGYLEWGTKSCSPES
ncbi:MAG TPA: bifunctional diaminohydroxyphosphoribosylaminopyrimidine deaminase/5-amino-6-(5-phosphoribosylamino)uracil reductase RibD [Thermodesulfobacteriota bacterium]|nr:bifunctional diaminohydroxyphosphoribosylaminopyrimidine deaminase/5-amino-6-(5-phosphoribosylamino)uracil reductase RibD [Thermodesulfobacteriota bacterium]